MADQNTKTTKQERPNKDEIKGLPAHAQYQFRQGTWYGKLFKTPISERWGKQICLNE